jgi:hypothetical protein
MTGWQRSRVVETRAALILADLLSVEDYAAYFDTQMHRGKGRRLLFAGYLWFTRAGRVLARLGWLAIGEGHRSGQ